MADLVRVGPVHFQSLEQELLPVAKYLSGHLLNAGAGDRDISAFLCTYGVTKTTRYDIASSDVEVVIGPLEAMPFPEATFDSVLCNAVLEHVADAEKSMGELARVVKPGGHVIAAVPFLQPFHACPGDYRRYTEDGLAELGRQAGLEVVCILPVHSIAQTLGWILWVHAQEKGGRLRKTAAWLIAFVLTRLWNRTDPGIKMSANTFQAVFRRPLEIESGLQNGWRRQPVPAATANIPTMLVDDELRLLNYLTAFYYQGVGAIVDAGSFLGGSTAALADGLRTNLRKRGLNERKLIHAFDSFEIEDWTRGIYFPESAQVGDSFLPSFERNVVPFSNLLEVHAGDIRSFEWKGGPVEILFIDLAKHWTTCDWVTWQFFPALIPGRSVVVQQDFLYHHWVAWLHVTMEYYADYFEYVCDTEVNSAVFLYTKQIPEDVLRKNTVAGLTRDEKIALMDRAADRFTGAKRELLISAKAHFLEMLERA